MTATSLFDLLARLDPPRHGTRSGSDKLTRLGNLLVESSLSDLERLRDYETEFAYAESDEDDGMTLELVRSVWQLYAEWAREAQQVLERVSALHPEQTRESPLSRLEKAYGGVRARLSLTPEEVIAGKDQAKRGDVVPVGELRDELRARRRA